MAEKKEVEEAVLVEIPTATTIAYKVGEETLDDRAMILKIYNMLKKIEKAVA